MAEQTLRSICPIFQVANYDRSVEFYTKVLGFQLAWSWGSPRDRASLCRDAVEITIEVERSPTPSQVYIQVAGVDAYYDRVTGAGATVVRAIDNRAYGMRDARIADPDGNHISIGEATVGS
jgi:predicted enzyme related to lactoylglutathione lyase